MTGILTSDARAVLERLQADDARQRATRLPPAQRTRNLDRESGRFLAVVVVSTEARAIAEFGPRPTAFRRSGWRAARAAPAAG